MEKEQLDLILVGRTGNGKSATGNSIINKKTKPFNTNYNCTSVTKEPQYDVCEFMDYKIQVVDSPGLFDSDLSQSDGIKLVHKSLQDAILANPDGYHAFLIVIKFATRFTKEEMKTINILKGILGNEFLSNFGIIVMTNGDTFKYEVEEEGHDLDYFCEQQDGYFKELLEECNNRIIVFDNQTKNIIAKTEQRKQLVNMVKQLSRNGSRYTNEHFEKAQQLYKQMLEYKTSVIDKNIVNAHSLILQKIKEIQDIKDESEKRKVLKNMYDQTNQLTVQIALNNQSQKFNRLLKNIEETQDLIQNLSKFSSNIEQTTKETVAYENSALEKEDNNEMTKWKELEINFNEIKKDMSIGFFATVKYMYDVIGCFVLENSLTVPNIVKLMNDIFRT